MNIVKNVNIIMLYFIQLEFIKNKYQLQQRNILEIKITNNREMCIKNNGTHILLNINMDLIIFGDHR